MTTILFKLGLATALVTTCGVALSQTKEPDAGPAIATGSTIEYIPPLARAVLTGDLKQVGEEIERQPDQINEPVIARKGQRAGFTPLIIAAALSDADIAETLIRHGAKVTAVDDYNRSALWYAALNEDVSLTKVLVSTDGPLLSQVVNEADSDLKRTPLHLAVRGNESGMVILLMGAGASEGQRDILGETPIDYCNRNHTVACKELK